jgi:antitoxin (DNA-binding transcriptional repressor) of toxin-antitoxin stability system
MTQVNIHYAKTHLSRLVEQALQGEEVVIAKDNKPLVKLTVVAAVQATPKKSAWEIARAFNLKTDSRTLEALLAPTDPEIIAYADGEIDDETDLPRP